MIQPASVQGQDSLRMPLDLSAGTFVKVLPMNDHTVTGVLSGAQIRHLLVDPLEIQAGKRKARPDLAEEIDLNAMIQRQFVGAKKANVASYTEYIRGLTLGTRKVGGLPPLELWSPQKLELVTDGGVTYAIVPPGAPLLFVDAQTQGAAIFANMQDPHVREFILKRLFSVVFYHNVDLMFARQLFHDFNALGVAVNTATALGMDTLDPFIILCRTLEDTIPALSGRIEKTTRQIRKDSPNLMTIQTLRQITVNIAKGMSGVQYGAKAVPIDGIPMNALRIVSDAFLRQLLGAFETEIADRTGSVLSSAAALSAVAALAHPALPTSDDEPVDQRGDIARAISVVRGVDWRKSEKWEGVAGKSSLDRKTGQATFSIGGPKEVGYTIYRALTDMSDPRYNLVRKSIAA